MTSSLRLLLGLCLFAGSAFAADKPIRALLITGGCCHNYTFQSQAITQAIGKKLTRPLQPDQVLAPIHVEQAEVVRRGDQVIISARSGGISVRMPGEALSDGGMGKQINVRNLGSQRVVKARVTGPGQVEVAM